MKLYGFCIAALEQQELGRIRVVATPIQVTDGKPETARTVEHLETYDKTLSLMEPPQVFACFSELVSMLEELVRLQNVSVDEAFTDYRPVALHIGTDGRKPVSFRAIHTAIFGLLPEALAAYADEKERQYCVAVSEGRRMNSEMGDNYPAAYGRLKPLMEKCTLKLGFFGGPMEENYDAQSYTPTEDGIKIAALGEVYRSGGEGAQAVYKELLYLAYFYGRVLAITANDLIETFAYNGPRGFQKYVEEHNTRFAEFTFFDWHPDFRAAFHEGFYRDYTGRRFKVIKLPTDPVNPYFMDPCMARICEQFEILGGSRAADAVEDRADLRGLIIDSCDGMLSATKPWTDRPFRGGNTFPGNFR